MGHPVTTNPFIIMLINMTIVFVVLIALSFLIQLIHKIDPTKKAEGEYEAELVDDEDEPVRNLPATSSAPDFDDDHIPAEVIAAIVAAVSAYGYSANQIHAVRVAGNGNGGWRRNAIVSGLNEA